MKNLKNLFEKTPGEDMPNLLGWTMIVIVNVATVVLFLTVYATCQGCTSSRIVRHTPMGDVVATSSTTPFTSDYSEDFNSDADYENCIAISRSLLADYRAGRVLNWGEMTPIQQTCFTQTAGLCSPDWRIDGIPAGTTYGPNAAMCGGTTGGGAGGAYGYGWAGAPTLNPYVRQ